MKSPKPLHKLLCASSDALSRVLGHAQRLSALDEKLRPLLGQPLAAHCRVANLRRGTLVIQVDSSAWAARLRYQVPGLLKTLRSRQDADGALNSLEDIQIKILPPAQVPQNRAARQVRMSGESARLIEAVAQSTDDPSLSSALRRLAGRSRNPDE
ncbi:MAG TPA: DciA family protein [Gammaproteobacteria bacterium]|nr:DciA family protein [Gammaproteobacteria bacterium]